MGSGRGIGAFTRWIRTSSQFWFGAASRFLSLHANRAFADMWVPCMRVNTGCFCSPGPDGEGSAGSLFKTGASLLPASLGSFSEGGWRHSFRLPGSEGSFQGRTLPLVGAGGGWHHRPAGLSCGLGLSWTDGHTWPCFITSDQTIRGQLPRYKQLTNP